MRRDDVAAAIKRGDVRELLRLAEGPSCACKGAVDNEPECFCRMNSRQVRGALSLAALRRGKIILLQMRREVGVEMKP